MDLHAGIKSTSSLLTEKTNTALAMGSGTLEVLATPALVALMEKAAFSGVEPYLEEGTTTVGTSISVKHLSATPLGMEAVCECELTEVDGRKLTFTLTARDKCGIIGTGIHERYIVNTNKFLAKVGGKKD